MRWVLGGVAAIVCWDALVAVAWNIFHVESAAFLLVDGGIYFGTAFQTTRDVGTVRAGAFAGAVVATTGWLAGLAVTLLIGPERSNRALLQAVGLIIGACIGAFVGLVAAFIARRGM